MATATRSFHLAVIGLVFIHLLASTAAEDNVVVHTSTNDASVAITEVHACVQPHDTAHHVRGATAPMDSKPRRLDASDVAGEEATTPATTASPLSCSCVCVVIHMREVAVEDTVPEPGGIRFSAATVKKVLPLLVVPFLPQPLSALVVLSSMSTPARAADDCRLPAYATCTVYRYLPDGAGVDRSRPLDDVRPVTCGPRQGRVEGPSPWYCHVRTLEFYDGHNGRVCWRVLSDHPPLAVADPAAVEGDVCYVELEHLNHREGYYIRCPVRKCPRLPFLSCSDSPHDALIWDRLTHLCSFLDSVGSDMYDNNTAVPKPKLDDA